MITRQIIFTLLFFFLPAYLISQCPLGDVTLSSQAEVNSFVTNFPTCDTIQGIFVIGYQDGTNTSDITDLSALGNLIAVKGNFYIRNNPNLTSITGLDALTAAGVSDFNSNTGVLFTIDNNSNLTSLSGLSNLNHVNGIFTINQNHSLTDLSGLEKLESLLYEDTVGQLLILQNDDLENLKGLDNLKEIYLISVRNNGSLTSLTGLESLEILPNLDIQNNENLTSIASLNHPVEITEFVSIANNLQLAVCNVEAICHYFTGNGDGLLDNNAEGCNGFQQVDCDGFGLSGTIFYDYNQNKIKDSFEGSPFTQMVNIQPDNVNVNPNSNGKYFLLGMEGTNYVLDWVDDPDWTLTTDFQNYSVTYTAGQAANKNNNFGLFPAFTSNDFSISIAAGQSRCDTEVAFQLRFQNQGTFIEDGMVEVAFDELYEFVSSSITPVSVDLVNRMIAFEFENLYPFAVIDVEIIFLMPDASEIGETALLQAALFREENGVLVAAAAYDHHSIMGCSFDPNDKLVLPIGAGEDHFTLKNEQLRYTLRFQNEGNLDAINVEIRDTLDTNLDWSTLKIMNSSHDVFTSFKDDGALSFYFQNIHLPPATLNDAGSQGFVSYEISPKAGLPDFTVIENTGFIYFDNNPPIVTNTTWNTLVDMFPTSTKELAAHSISIHPNPTSNIIFIENPDGIQIDQALLYNQLGQLVLSSQQNQIDVGHLPAGLYMLKVKLEKLSWMGKLVIE